MINGWLLAVIKKDIYLVCDKYQAYVTNIRPDLHLTDTVTNNRPKYRLNVNRVGYLSHSKNINYGKKLINGGYSHSE